jgi:hypothetical protein
MRNAEICWSDSISEFRRSGLEGLRPFIIRRRNHEVAKLRRGEIAKWQNHEVVKSRSGKIVKCRNREMRNGEMILAIRSRCDLGRQIQEVNMVDHVRKDSRGPLDQEDAWRKIRAPQRLHFRVSQIGKSKGKRFKLAICEITKRS